MSRHHHVGHQVTGGQRLHDASQRSDVEQRSSMGQQHASLSQRSDVGHQLKAGKRADTGRYLYDDNDDDDNDDDNDNDYYVGQQSGVSRHHHVGHQVTGGQRLHDAGQRSDVEQHSSMGQQHASLSQRSDVGHQGNAGQRTDADQRSDISIARQHTNVFQRPNAIHQSNAGQRADVKDRSDARQCRDGEYNAKMGQCSNSGHVYDRIDSKQHMFEMCQQRLVDTNSSYMYNAKTCEMEVVNLNPLKSLDDLNEIVLTDEFLTDTDMMLRKMCNLGYDFNTKKSSRTYDDPNSDTAYYESANDADDDAEDDDVEDEDEDGGDDDKDHERAIYCSERAEDFVKSQLRKQTNPNSCERSCCQSSLNASNNDQTIKNACYHQTFMNLAVSLLWYVFTLVCVGDAPVLIQLLFYFIY